MIRIQHRLVAVVAAAMTGDHLVSVEDTNPCVGGDQGEWTSNRIWRDGVVIEIKADIDGLGRTNGNHQIGVEGMEWQRQQARLFFGERLRHGATIVSWPGALMCDLVSPA